MHLPRSSRAASLIHQFGADALRERSNFFLRFKVAQGHESNFRRHEETHGETRKPKPARHDHVPSLFLYVTVCVARIFGRDSRAADERNVDLAAMGVSCQG